MIYRTDRLAARRLTMEDAPAMLAIYGDREAMRYVGDGSPLLLEHCEHWVDVTDRNFERRGYGMMGFLTDDGDLVACAGIVHPGQQLEPEVKYAVRRDQWRKGYGTEICKSLVQHSFTVLGLAGLQATVYSENLPSKRILSGCGFTLSSDRTADNGKVVEVWFREAI